MPVLSGCTRDSADIVSITAVATTNDEGTVPLPSRASRPCYPSTTTLNLPPLCLLWWSWARSLLLLLSRCCGYR